MYFILVVFAILGADGKPVDGIHLATAKTQFENVDACKKALPKVIDTLMPVLKKSFPGKTIDKKADCVTEAQLATIYAIANSTKPGPGPQSKSPQQKHEEEEQKKQDENNKI